MIRSAVKKGLHEATITPAEFREPLSARGTTSRNPVTVWEARISNLDKTRPDCVARNEDPDAAMSSALSLFCNQKNSPASRSPARTELDDIDDLV